MTRQRPSPSQSPGAVLARLPTKVTDVLLGVGSELREVGPDQLRYPATISIWVRWFLFAICVFLLVYRPTFTYSTYVRYILCLVVLIAGNGYLHYRLLSGRDITSLMMLVIALTDVVLITVGIVIAGGFNDDIIYLFYYPAVAWFAVFFSSFKLSLGWVTFVTVIFTTVSLTVGEGLSLEAKDDKVLIARIVIMYAVVISVNLVARSERIRRLEAVAREREMQRQRLEMSQTIHDTTAQSAYTLGLGLEDAIEKADSSDPELVAKLEAMWSLTKSAMWTLRHPIDGGQIFSGSTLSEVLEAHADTFTAITSIPAAAGPARSRTATVHRNPQPAVLHRPQCAHQCLSPFGRRWCDGLPGVRRGDVAVVGCRTTGSGCLMIMPCAATASGT